jgi:hypothetical protein
LLAGVRTINACPFVPSGSHLVLVTVTNYGTRQYKTDWQDPLALFVALAGVGAGFAIALSAFRR